MLETTYQPMWFASAPSAHCSGKVWPAATDLLDFLRETYLHTRTCVKKDGAPSNDRLRILELGSGTGYAGLTLMRTLSASTAVDITMTEMLDAGAAHRLALNIRLNAGVVGLRLENREEKDQDVTLGQDCISTPLWWVQTSDAVDPMAIGTVGRRSRLRALPMDWADVVVSLDGAASLPPQLLTEVASSSSSPGIRSLSPSPPSSSPNWLDEARVTLEREGLTGDVDNDVVRVPSPKPTPSVQAVPALPTKVPPPPHDFDLLVGSDLCYNDVSVALLCRAVSALLRRHAREDYVSDGLGCEARCFYAHTVGRWGARYDNQSVYRVVYVLLFPPRSLRPSVLAPCCNLTRRSYVQWLRRTLVVRTPLG
eukprot:TRINITY_DN1793_c0_g2_i1.p1 TRINITY_DN1793_c0_g2~~TRINITY_DN1793_c0_g2_i1.p1  ORF type:complete len:367 (-),score=17.57 TRINITY_DN1793_c0_g2_i1:294-1394(-)